MLGTKVKIYEAVLRVKLEFLEKKTELIRKNVEFYRKTE